MITKIKAFSKVLQESRHPFRMILGQLLVKTGLHRFFKISMNGYKLNFSRSSLAVSIFADPDERHDDEDVLRKILKPGSVYADIGANIGTLVLTASPIVGQAGKVIAMEAHPVTFNNLAANVRLNKFSNIILINSAAGQKKGSIFFSNINSDDQNKVLLQHTKGIEVKLDTLDNLLADESMIDLLKIDVEGYEKFVLEGATATLQKTAIVYFESWEKHFNDFGYDTERVLSILRRAGFEVFKPVNNTLTILPHAYCSETCENLIAIKNTTQFCADYGYHLAKP